MAILVRFPVTDLSGLKYPALAKRPPVACGKFRASRCNPFRWWVRAIPNA